MMAEVDIAVVGAGLAGTVAANELQQAGFRVVVLEASGRVGGRTRTRYAADEAVDGGGAYSGEQHTEVRALARRLGVGLVPTGSFGADVYDLRGQHTVVDGPLPPLSALALGDMLERIEELAATVDPAAPGLSPDAAHLDRLNVRQWADEELRHEDARLALSLLVQEMLAAEPVQVSVLHLLFYVRSGGGLPFLTAFEGGAQQDRFAGGAQQLTQRLAAGLAEPPRLGMRVGRLARTADGVRIEGDWGTLTVGQAILAAPAGALAAPCLGPGIEPPAAPPSTAGASVKLHIAYPEPFWRNAGLSGRATSDRGPLRFVVDDSQGRSGGLLVAFVTGAHAARYARLAPQARRGAVLGRLAEWFGPAALKPSSFTETDWQTQPFASGCYAAVPAPGAWARLAHRRPGQGTGPVHFAGTENSPLYYGHLEGAVRSGRAAATAAVQALGERHLGAR